MITAQEIRNLVTEWGLREDVIEKDYVIGWVLWSIGSDPDLKAHWAFKGGTALKKCYVETWRFSEDLDFTVLPGGPDRPESIEPVLKRILERVHDESGIDFSVRPLTFRHNEQFQYTEGGIYYKGPRNTPSPARIKLDISGSEKIARPTVLRPIGHPYSDTLPEPAQVRCYAFDEVFAEKLRAMSERGRPRDLYDIVLLFRRKEFHKEADLIKSVLEKKCRFKNIAVPTLRSIQESENKAELISEWSNMLRHQLNTLPPFEQFWEELPSIFEWLEGRFIPEKVASIQLKTEEKEAEDPTWRPPPTIWQWGLGIPLESIRFAAINHLCVELEYMKQGERLNHYLLEPYALRRTQGGNLLLYALKSGSDEPMHTYRIDRIRKITVTTTSFKPRFEIEFSSAGQIHAKPTASKASTSAFYGIAGNQNKKDCRVLNYATTRTHRSH